MGRTSEPITGLGYWENTAPDSLAAVFCPQPQGDTAASALVYALMYPRFTAASPGSDMISIRLKSDLVGGLTLEVVRDHFAKRRNEQNLSVVFINSKSFWDDFNRAPDAQRREFVCTCLAVPNGTPTLRLSVLERALKNAKVGDTFITTWNKPVLADSTSCLTDRTLVLVNGSFSQRKWHQIMSTLPALIPEFFKSHPLNETELQLCKALTEDTDDHFIEISKSLYDQYDFRGAAIALKLTGFTKSRYSIQLRNLTDRLNNRRAEQQEVLSRITAVSREITKLELTIQGLALAGDASSDDDDAAFVAFFKKNKNLTLRSVSDGEIYFTVKNYLSNYDIDMMERLLDNPRSFYSFQEFYPSEGPTNRISVEDWKKLLRAIFIEGKIKVQMWSSFELDFDTGHISFGNDTNPFDKTVICNPHLVRYHCLGGNAMPLGDAVKNYDYLMAVNLCIVATGNLNVGEHPNAAAFVRELYQSQALELPDGKHVGVREAIAYLKG